MQVHTADSIFSVVLPATGTLADLQATVLARVPCAPSQSLECLLGGFDGFPFGLMFESGGHDITLQDVGLVGTGAKVRVAVPVAPRLGGNNDARRVTDVRTRWRL